MPTTIGGKDPTRQPKKKLPLLMIVAHGEPKGDAPEPGGQDEPSDKAATPAPEGKYAGKGPGGKTIQPGEAGFTNQTQTCSKCSYFDPTGNDAVGECKMGVPEADFETSDPDASQCKYFEEADEGTNESPAEEQAENEPAEAKA